MILLNGEDNANAHLKRQVMGREVIVAFTNGKLNFGPWEQVFYGEFDGRRNQRALKNINLYAKEKTVTAFIVQVVVKQLSYEAACCISKGSPACKH